jgi:hypothetical protein
MRALYLRQRSVLRANELKRQVRAREVKTHWYIIYTKSCAKYSLGLRKLLTNGHNFQFSLFWQRLLSTVVKKMKIPHTIHFLRDSNFCTRSVVNFT